MSWILGRDGVGVCPSPGVFLRLFLGILVKTQGSKKKKKILCVNSSAMLAFLFPRFLVFRVLRLS